MHCILVKHRFMNIVCVLNEYVKMITQGIAGLLLPKVYIFGPLELKLGQSEIHQTL